MKKWGPRFDPDSTIHCRQYKSKLRRDICVILYNHAHELEDDPERLTTDFIVKTARIITDEE